MVPVTDELLRVPEVARLDIEGPAVYQLIRRGELGAAKGDDGLVYVSTEALRDDQRRHATTGS